MPLNTRSQSPIAVGLTNEHNTASHNTTALFQKRHINIPNFKPSSLTFSPFPRLPTELQLMIWKLASRDWVLEFPLDITTVFSGSQNAYGLRLEQTHEMIEFPGSSCMALTLSSPPLLWICRFSRAIMMDTLAWACIENCFKKHNAQFERMRGLFYLSWDRKTGNGEEEEEVFTVIPDFRVGASVMRRVVGADGRKSVVAATREERECGGVKTFWTREEILAL